MPLPEPRTDENQDEFVSRCMEEVSGEFEDEDQALAVCFSQWREADSAVVPISSHPGFTEFRAADDGMAEILIYEDVGEGWFGGISAKDFAKQLSSLGSVKELNVRLNSPGGSVFDGVAIYNLLRQHPANITTTIDGIAASIASIIFQAGDRRVMAANGSYMIHDPWTMAYGSADDLRRQAEVLDKLADSLRTTYVNRSGLTAETVRELMSEETWFSATEALEAGFVDEVVEDLPVAASVQFNLSRFRHVPDTLGQACQGKVARVDWMEERERRIRLANLAKVTLDMTRRSGNGSENRRAAGSARRT